MNDDDDYDTKIIKIIQNSLLEWGKFNSRHFPWRETTKPYEVLVSEILLHRTRAEQVLPVYNRFIRKYPNFQSICIEKLNNIILELNSLGLKWRAEELHSLACLIIKKYNGKVPDNKEELLKLPGIGPYISSAVMNFAYNQPEPLLDTNTVRIIGRVFGMEITDSSRRSKIFEEIMISLVNFQFHRLFLWSMIDLAFKICRPVNPLCMQCPLNNICHYNQDV